VTSPAWSTSQPAAAQDTSRDSWPSSSAPPAVSLPKGGGAIRGIGEKFGADPVTGTGALSVPLAVSPGRSGFGPSLALGYDSGAGNGPFGFGWGLSLPAITRKTDKGLPRYQSGPEDVFVLSGSEDLVPVLEEIPGTWQPVVARRSLGGREYAVRRYRPRIEGLFARIERWTDLGSGETHWRSITGDNVTTAYGTTAESRIADPADPARVFSWLICESYDDKGNAIVYGYKNENGDGVDLAAAHEANRTAASRSAGRYLKRIRYGNRVSRLVEPDLSQADWMFEVVFDYGEHDADEPGPAESRPWRARLDPFSSYRAGFEVRTYRLCERVLMFHHFPEEDGVGRDCLVRSTDLAYRADPVASVVTSIVQSGYCRNAGGGYRRKSLPPLEFTYSEAVIDEQIRYVDPESLENLPYGVDDSTYRWVDLDGEGLSGILTDQASAWFYKPSLGGGRFGPTRLVATKPSLAAAAGGRQELLDLAGDGQLDLVGFGRPTPGFFERTEQGWAGFRPFRSQPNVDWDDPNLRFADLTGAGHADMLIGEGDALTWYPSLAEDGFGPTTGARQSADEERGPQFLFAGQTHAQYLADMSGDGLPDVVRIGNGEVSYWPNLGYGRFGKRVNMDDVPWFDEQDQFDHQRIRLADIDGSGTTDLLYLHRDGVRIYANRSGNGWSPPHQLGHAFPGADSVAQVTTIDLLGNGTACLVWSSPLSADAGRPLRYVDLMGGHKPHLLTVVRNNLGAETHIGYAPSTRFYLGDKAAGRPWITRLPFPVHVVERVEILDRVSHNRFVTHYAYHHGYYDGVEREFRGFGMVEQSDTETFAALAAGGQAANIDEAIHVPPVLTRTWFHTGAATAERVSRQFADEYYREADHGDAHPDELLLPDTVLPSTIRRPGRDPLPWRLSSGEEYQACRVLKGSVLRQEVYALDGSEAEGRPYEVSEHNYTIELLQPAIGDHAVFFVHPRETITAHYERALYPVAGKLVADPRVGHELTLAVDDFGNALRSVSIGYGRRHDDPDPVLTPADRDRQRSTHMVLTEANYTNPIDEADAYRTPQPAESRMYEVLGLLPDSGRAGSTNLFGFEELARKLAAGQADMPYEQWDADPASLPRPARRLIEHTRTRYRRDDLTGPLPLGELESMALPFESYRLAFPDHLRAGLYGDRVGETTLAEVGGYVHEDGGWWIPSGQVFYSPVVAEESTESVYARSHFFLPHCFRNPFGSITEVSYDEHGLFVGETRDPLGNRTTAQHDYRVLQPRLLADANGNRNEVAFDALGMVAGTAVMGKPGEGLGDSLAGFDADPADAVLAAYLQDPFAEQHDLLRDATTRLVYDLFAFSRTRDDLQPQPAVVATLARETHASDLPNGQQTAIQQGLAYTDGFGREIQRKAQAEVGPLDEGGPEISPRWTGNGWTIFNNKGKPVRQYEPFFSASHQFEFAVLSGVSSVLFYDPLERVVATMQPSHIWEKVVFDTWQQATWDVNDTVLLDPQTDLDIGGYVRPYLAGVGGWLSWHARRADGELGPAEQAAAGKAAAHAGTPSRVWLDTLGRPFLTVEQNRAAETDEFLSTRVRVDIGGNEREVVDAADRLIMCYGYDMLGRRVQQASMEAGERLLLNDVTGKPIYSWNSRGFRTRTEYDPLHRPVFSFVQRGDLTAELLDQVIEYGESQPDDQRNLRTRMFRQHDAAGMLLNEAYDFKGNLLVASRQLAVEYKQTLDWLGTVPLEDPPYTTKTSYDALNRPTSLTTPDGSVVRPSYNEANLLERLDTSLRGAEGLVVFVDDVDYNAHGQRTRCLYGNGIHTEYHYDPLTFRLSALRTLRGNEPLQDLSYTYDPVGNITQIQDNAQQTIFFRNRLVEPSSDYTYDAIYRLVEASGREHLGQMAGGGLRPVPNSHTDAPRIGLLHPGDGNVMGRYLQRYVYDEVGNFLEMIHHGADPANPGWRRTYHYSEASLLESDRVSNRLTSTSASDDGITRQEFDYDPHGNITSMPEVPLMRWDYRDQLQASARQVVTNNGVPETTYYVYGASGQRIRMITERQASVGQTPIRINERIYLGGFEIHRRYRNDGITAELERQTLHIMNSTQRIALVETRTLGNDGSMAQIIRYQLSNHLGSASIELDDQAQVISYEEYTPYGSTSYQATRSQMETPKRYRYTGKERDEETGLNYHGTRYYVPWLGRWSSADPAGMVDGTNLYRYSRDNPVRLIDIAGMQPIVPEDRDTQFRRGTFGSSMPRPGDPSGALPGDPADALPIDFGGGSRGALFVEPTVPEPPKEESRSTWKTRILGGLSVVSGFAQGAIGSALLFVPGGQLAGALLIAHGVDTAAAGALQAISAENTRTLTSRGFGLIPGVSPEAADTYDAVLGLIGSAAGSWRLPAARLLAPSAPRTAASSAGEEAPPSAARTAASSAPEDANVVFRSDTSHIFRKAAGHLIEDSPENRALLQGTVKPQNLIGVRGPSGSISVYRDLLPDGRQVWVEVRNGTEITNGGVNDVPRP
jgi:RHS repeat-associated protein